MFFPGIQKTTLSSLMMAKQKQNNLSFQESILFFESLDN
jgi:hypothetical protein